MARSPNTLLGPSDPEPVRQTGKALAEGPFLLLGDHAGAAIPQALNNLGLPQLELKRHIALDLGVEQLGLALSERLSAPFLHQVYSRLVIDCNRDPAHPGSVPPNSDGTRVPGNQQLSEIDRQERIASVFHPYHRAIADVLDARRAAGLDTVLVSLHSFTPVMDGFERPWHMGVLHQGHRDEFALRVLGQLQREPELSVADNCPYAMDETDYTVLHHAFPRGLRYLELEIRQDVIGTRRDELTHLLAAAFTKCAT